MRIREGALAFGALVVSAALLELGCRALIHYRQARNPDHIPLDEVTLRLFLPGKSGLPFSVKPHFRQRFRSSEFDTIVNTNNLGFRGTRDLTSFPVDVGILGDSFAFGYGVNDDETVAEKLQTLLPGRSVFSYSYANGGFPVDYYLFLKANENLIPRHAVMLLFLMNDLPYDGTERNLVLGDDGAVVSAESKLKDVMPDGTLVIRGPASRHYDWFRLLAETGTGRMLSVLYGRFVTKTYEPPREPAATNGDRASSYYEGQLGPLPLLVLDHVTRLKQLVDKKGSRFTVFLIPEAFMVDETHPCWFSPAACRRVREGKLVQKAVTAWLGKHGVEVVDPTDELTALERQGTKLYFKWDAHWTADGHAAAARLLARRLDAIH